MTTVFIANINAFFHGYFQKCTLCSKEYSVQSKLNAHMKIHTGDLLECAICGKSFTGSYQLKQHLATHNPRVKLETVCAVCGKVLPLEKGKRAGGRALIKHFRDKHPGITDHCPV